MQSFLLFKDQCAHSISKVHFCARLKEILTLRKHKCYGVINGPTPHFKPIYWHSKGNKKSHEMTIIQTSISNNCPWIFFDKPCTQWRQQLIWTLGHTVNSFFSFLFQVSCLTITQLHSILSMKVFTYLLGQVIWTWMNNIISHKCGSITTNC